MATEFRLPELGENIKSGDLVRILVSVGDAVSQDQPVLELETDKATIEVPSPVAGKVKEIFVKDGDKVNVGQLIFTVDGEGGATPSAEPAAERSEAAVAAPTRKAETSTLGTGRESPVPQEGLATESARVGASSSVVVPLKPATEMGAHPLVPAAPSARRVAREFGVDIGAVPGSGPGGRISADDVRQYARAVLGAGEARTRGVVAPPLPDFAKWGGIERKPMSQVRRKTAEHMAQAWANVCQVTQFDQADVTHLEEIRRQYSERVEKSGGKLTVTAIALKVAAAALKVFPQFAASVDMARGEIIYKKYCHIGVAVDTERGLLVPVIRDVDRKNILQLSIELSQVAEKARNKKLTLEEMEGGVFTITNLGGIGGTYFSPIVNYPEVAILGISRSRLEPVYIRGQFEPRLMLPLSLSYDHRLIDGADAARFLRWVAEALEQPFLLPLQG
jgi:pyruvate dehydrogenase E2 component (dihydrolipoamide acetyltransferase)